MSARMRLIVARHGKADQHSDSGRDEGRHLLARGERQAHFLGERLADFSDPPSLIVASPIVRAYDTAVRLNTHIDADLVSDTRLRVGEPVAPILELITEHARHTALCIVGHNPTLESLCGVLIAGPGAPPVRLRTGEAYVFDINPHDPAAGGAKPLVQIRLEE